MSDYTQLDQLLERVSRGEVSALDFQDLKAALDQGDDAVVERIHAFHSARAAENKADSAPYDPAYWQDIVRAILAVDKEVEEPLEAPVIRRLSNPHRWIAAAAILILFGAGYLLWPRHSAQPIIAQQPARPAHDALPGGNKAILTLAGGKQIILDSAGNGLIAQQGGASVNKTYNGQIIYSRQNSYINDSSGHRDPSNRSDSSHRSFSLRSGTETMNAQINTLATPRGGQYQLTLSDGTKVWLNSSSSITYPTAFTGQNREVTVTGEAYFEVARRPSQPFRVAISSSPTGEDKATVEVLGTAFNINAYPDEAAIKTTLLEGSIKVNKSSITRLIKPGQQARIEDPGNPLIPQIKVQTTDTVQAVAWKNGYFAFDQTDLPTLLRTLARWYDVDIVYQGAVPQRVFSGKIGRTLTLSQVLHFLTKAKIHYTIENGRTLTIAP